MKVNRIARKGALLASATLVATMVVAQAHAAAFYIQEQSTKAVGRAFSGEVSEMGAQQMWWNPASIGGISGFQSYQGFTAIIPRADASNLGSTITRPGVNLSGVTGIPGLPSIPGTTSAVGGAQNQHDMVNKGYLPNGGFAFPIGDHLDFGFTATSPYSFTSNYASDSWARYAADKTRLRTFDFQPVLAYHTGGLSIGAGPNIEYVRATFANYLPDPLPNLAGIPVVGPTLSGLLNTGDGHQYLKGDGWDVGWSAGFQYHNDQVDLGVAYKSAIKHKLKGHLIVDGLGGLLALGGANQEVEGAHAQFTTPWQVNFGGRYHVTRQLTLNGQITRFGWSKFDAIELSNLGATADQALGQNYHNTFSYAAGFDYAVTPKWTVRGGVQRDLSPISKGNRDPRVPDGSRWNFAAGSSYAINSHFTMDAAASYDKIKSVHIDKTEAAYVGTPFETIIQNDGYLHNASALVFSLGGSVAF
ncbi:OmpP1/FadL family transporter [Sphingomonas abietis]|uniref:Outer membrane protein transport protein n=1 Tax=Sphingomonas abietis TaxID=3012344 RepID=A0ABY7NPV5_9SPHN|nr:outer membrane protein transport protein [Sphingomonas abietis]WBO22985.1 outer membrane protein transport protein [Sphingomonas abietis]